MNERFRQDNTEGYSDEALVIVNRRYAAAVEKFIDEQAVEEDELDLSILDAMAERILTEFDGEA